MQIWIRTIVIMLFYRAITLGFRFPARFLGSSSHGIGPRHSRVTQLLDGPGINMVKNEKVERKPKDQRYRDFIDCLKTKDSDRALALLKNVTMVNDRMFVTLMNNIATVLYKKEHLGAVQDIIDRLTKIGVTPDEPLYSSLVKCQMDAGNCDEALKVFDYMVNNSIEVKSRTIIPILEGLRNINDIDRMIPLLEYISHSTEVKPEHVTVVLETLGQMSNKPLNETQQVALEAFLNYSSLHLLGLPFEDLQSAARHFNNLTQEAQKEEGVLVQFAPDSVVDGTNLKTKGYVIAHQQQMESVAVRMREAMPCMVNTDPNHPIGMNELGAASKDITEKLFVRSAVDILRKSTSSSLAKIVNIDARTCQCPNCNAKLASLALTEDEKRVVRSRLRNISKEVNTHLSQLKEFLRGYLEFDYIIDAANVAYYNQNEVSGRFSYRQLELLVRKLKKKSNRILLVISQGYCQPKIPNSITGVAQRMTPYEKNILDKLYQEVAVYKVPSYTNDDWFWLYCSVMPRRRTSKPCYIVSNDLTRDHKIAFPDSSTFARWRLTQCTYFDLFRDDHAMSDRADSEMFIYEPGAFSRLMQKNMDPSTGQMRWHIPSVDRSSWLCVATGTSPAGIPEMPHMMATRNRTSNSNSTEHA